MKQGLMKLKNRFERIDWKQVKISIKSKLFGMNMTDGWIFKIVVYSMLIALAFVFLYPVIHIIVTSLKTDEDIMNRSLKWIPSKIEWENYKVVLSELGLYQKEGTLFQKIISNALFQSIVIAGLPALGTLLATSLAGYGFARFEFPFKKVLFGLMLSTFIIAPQILHIPQFIWFRDLNFTSSVSNAYPKNIFDWKGLWEYFKPLSTFIVPALLGQGLNSAIFILIFYSMFRMIPTSLIEAAKIDGANNWTIFRKVAVPLTKSGYLIVFLFSFVWYWNEEGLANIYFGRTNLATLPMRLQRYISGVIPPTSGSILMRLYQPEKMAATLITIIPLLVIYFALQRYFVESIDRTGLTGE